MAPTRFVIYGSRPDGHAKMMLTTCEDDLGGMKCVGLIDDFPENRDNVIHGVGVIGGREDLDRIARDVADVIVFGFADGAARAELVPVLEAAGFQLPVIRHPTASVGRGAEFGPGSQVMFFARVGPDAKIGPAALLNTASAFSHDSRGGAGITVGPGSHICGRCTVGDGATFGSCCVVIPDITVGAGANVGAGAAVVSDVAPGATVVGVPARPIEERR